jgi:ornithine cyclodeaminase/alanine dehydrogenase
MPLFLREEDVRTLLTMDEALTAVEDVFRRRGLQQADNRPRQRAHAGKAVLSTMPAAVQGVGLGLKAYTVARSAVRFVVLLWDEASGDLEAVIEADNLGRIRTGAASGVATRFLARPDAATLAVFGSGWQAATQLAAVCRVRPIRQAWVYSRNADRRAAFAAEMTATHGIDVRAAESAHQALAEADVVCTITTANEPLFDGAWLAPGVHLNVAGSNRPTTREVDDTTLRRAAVVAVDDVAQAQDEAGDLLLPIAAGVLDWSDVVPFADIVAGKVPGRAAATDITLFKSLGVAMEDVAVARVVVDKARAAGLGVELPETRLG